MCSPPPTPPTIGAVVTRSTGNRFGPACPETVRPLVPKGCPEVEVSLDLSNRPMSKVLTFLKLQWLRFCYFDSFSIYVLTYLLDTGESDSTQFNDRRNYPGRGAHLPTRPPVSCRFLLGQRYLSEHLNIQCLRGSLRQHHRGPNHKEF